MASTVAAALVDERAQERAVVARVRVPVPVNALNRAVVSGSFTGV